MKHTKAISAHRRAQRSFWLLVMLCVLAAGSLSSALVAPPSPLTGLRVAASGLLLLGSGVLALRVMVAIERARRTAGHFVVGPDPHRGPPSRTSRRR